MITSLLDLILLPKSFLLRSENKKKTAKPREYSAEVSNSNFNLFHFALLSSICHTMYCLGETTLFLAKVAFYL